ncbi:MAG: 2-oxo-4-hydroxy-4-carboxy-5-ureidoimidazoline decarboxylase [Pseudomonadota bacterium]
MTTPLRQPPSTLDSAEFTCVYGGVYEHSPWVAKAVWAARRGSALDSVEALHAALKAVVEAASDEAKLALIRAHPELASRAAIAKGLSAASQDEQKGAGLDACTPQEFAEFHALNGAYHDKFGFPFILAIKGMHRQAILAEFRRRLDNGRAREFAAAIGQIHRIAHFRLMALAAPTAPSQESDPS